MEYNHKKHPKWWTAASLYCEKSTHGRYSRVEESNSQMDSDDQLEMNPQAPTHKERRTIQTQEKPTENDRSKERTLHTNIDLQKNRLCMTVCDQHRTLEKIFRGA